VEPEVPPLAALPTKLGEVFSILFKSDKDDKPLKNKVS
jgi:hypothetical protein